MISPAVSRWVTPGPCGDMTCFTESGPTTSACADHCGVMCAHAIAGTGGNGGASFMSAIFTGLSD